MNLRGPVLCTLTGVDRQTDLDAIANLSVRFPWVEWGFLYSPNRAGNDPRYPDPGWIEQAVGALGARSAQIRVALHVCGDGVAELATASGAAARLAHTFAHALGVCARLQLNFNAAQKPEVATVAPGTIARCLAGGGIGTITQFNGQNASLCRDLLALPGHAVLVDGSGGRGETPCAWPAAEEVDPYLADSGRAPMGLRIGYAGGLGPKTLSRQLPAVATAAGGHPFWIDMESSLRDSKDRFSLVTAEAVLARVAAFRCGSLSKGSRSLLESLWMDVRAESAPMKQWIECTAKERRAGAALVARGLITVYGELGEDDRFVVKLTEDGLEAVRRLRWIDPSNAEFEADLRAIARRAGGSAPEFAERILAAGPVVRVSDGPCTASGQLSVLVAQIPMNTPDPCAPPSAPLPHDAAGIDPQAYANSTPCDRTGFSYFRACLGDAYRPSYYGQHEGVHPKRVREAMAALAGRPEADVIAALVKQHEVDRQRFAVLGSLSGDAPAPGWTPSLTTPAVLNLLNAGKAGSETFLPSMDQMTRRYLRELAEAWLHVHAGGPQPPGPVYGLAPYEEDDEILPPAGHDNE